MTEGIEGPFNRLTRRTASKKKRKSQSIISRRNPSAFEVHDSRHMDETFHEVIDEARNVQLPELLDAVYETGEKLKENPVFANVSQYRQAVKAFMNHVVRSIFIAEEKVSGFAILKRKKFILLRVIDKKLQGLAEEVLQRQRRQLDILDTIDQINGLLVDLVS